MARPSFTRKLIPLLIGLLAAGAVLADRVGAEPPHPPTPIPLERLGRPPAAVLPAPQINLTPVTTRTDITALVTRVDGNRWHADVTTLARFGASTPGGWGTRRTLTAGNLAARDWIAATFSDLGWSVSFQSFFLIGGASYNVIGERRGFAYPEDIYIIGAHMDSTSPQSTTLAPGAEDNASGTAALLEIARVLQDRQPASTIRLIAFSGEEQGLVGSSAYVSYLQNSSHELDHVKGVYIMDMIGYTSDPNYLHVVLESRNPSLYPWMGDLRDHLTSVAATYTTLHVFVSNGVSGSDHVPFLYRQVPAVLLIGAEAREYPYYHTTEDLPSHVVPVQGAEIIKLLVATLADRPGVLCILGDLNCDTVVEVAELVELAAHWRGRTGAPGYDARYDLNRDGRINVVDVELAAAGLAE